MLSALFLKVSPFPRFRPTLTAVHKWGTGEDFEDTFHPNQEGNALFAVYQLAINKVAKGILFSFIHLNIVHFLRLN